MSTQWAILDRDGVINFDSPNYIKTPEEWVAIPGSVEAIAALTRAGVRIVVATNQANIERGAMSTQTLSQIHEKMQLTLAHAGGLIERIYVCPHAPETQCECRKPKPGLLLQAAAELNIELSSTPFVGDSIKDLLAAKAVGAVPVLVRTGNGAVAESSQSLPAHTVVFDNLLEFASSMTTGAFARR